MLTPQKILVPKKIECKKNWAQRNFGSKKIVSPKELQVQKNVGSKGVKQAENLCRSCEVIRLRQYHDGTLSLMY